MKTQPFIRKFPAKICSISLLSYAKYPESTRPPLGDKFPGEKSLDICSGKVNLILSFLKPAIIHCNYLHNQQLFPV